MVEKADKIKLENKIINVLKTIYDPEIPVDIFELDLSALCSTLKIEHSKIMEREYAMFLDYCHRILKI